MKIPTLLGVVAIIVLVALSITGQVSSTIAAYGSIAVIVLLCLGAVIRKKLKG